MDRLLVVESDAVAADAVGAFFETFGYAVHLAATHADAVRRIRYDQPDFVLTDLVTGALDGGELVMTCRSLGLELVDTLTTVKAFSDARRENVSQAAPTGLVERRVDAVRLLPQTWRPRTAAPLVMRAV